MLTRLLMAVTLVAVMGCMSQISLTEKKGCTSAEFCASVTEVTYRGRAKDLMDVAMVWRNTFSLKLGKATTAADPYNDLLIEVGGPIVEAAICAQNPLSCPKGDSQ